MDIVDVSNSGQLDDSILNVIGQMTPNYEYSSSANGEEEYEDEESVEYEDSDAYEAGGVEEQDLPRFRQLVRMKKLEYKAKYGKAHFGKDRKCTNIKYPCPTWKKPFKICSKEQCILIPKFISGWRKEWRKFKHDGGLARLKQESKGFAVTPSVNAPAPAPAPVKPISGTSKPFVPTDGSMYGGNLGGGVGDNSERALDDNKKILGMPPALAIGLGALVVIVGGVIAYKALKK